MLRRVSAIFRTVLCVIPLLMFAMMTTSNAMASALDEILSGIETPPANSAPVGGGDDILKGKAIGEEPKKPKAESAISGVMDERRELKFLRNIENGASEWEYRGQVHRVFGLDEKGELVESASQRLQSGLPIYLARQEEDGLNPFEGVRLNRGRLEREDGRGTTKGSQALRGLGEGVDTMVDLGARGLGIVADAVGLDGSGLTEFAEEREAERDAGRTMGEVLTDLRSAYGRRTTGQEMRESGWAFGWIVMSIFVFVLGILSIGAFLFSIGTLLIFVGRIKNWEGFTTAWTMFSFLWFIIFGIFYAMGISDFSWGRILILSVLGFVIIGNLFQGAINIIHNLAWDITNAGKRLGKAIHGSKARPECQEKSPPHENEQMPHDIHESFVILGLNSDASKAEIKKAYRAAIMRAHPDKGGTHQRAIAVNAARKILRKNGYL